MKAEMVLCLIFMFLVSCSEPDKKASVVITQQLAATKCEKSLEDPIVGYTKHFYSRDRSSPDFDLTGYDTLDVRKFDTVEKKVELQNGKYVLPWFSVKIPEDFYPIDSEFEDGTVLKSRELDLYYYIFSPQWTKPSVYLKFDFNSGEFRDTDGMRIEKLEVDAFWITAVYRFPMTSDGYKRDVSLSKSLAGGGMEIKVKIYRNDDDLRKVAKSIDFIDGSFTQYGD